MEKKRFPPMVGIFQRYFTQIFRHVSSACVCILIVHLFVVCVVYKWSLHAAEKEPQTVTMATLTALTL